MLGKEKAELIDSNMGGTTPRQLSKEFAAARKLRPNLQRACGHIILSIPHREADHFKGEYHEHLDNDQYVEIAHRWLKAMNFLADEESQSPQPEASCQYALARHHDTNHEHIHIIASRIRMDGSVVPDSWDYRRSEVVVRQLEKEFGLEPTPCSNDRVADIVKEQGIDATVSERKARTRKQKHHSSNKPPITQLLADAIDQATQDNPTMTQLIGRLQHQGIAVHPTFSTRGLFREALAFEMDGVRVAGNKLGSAYSFPGLQKKRGVSYDSERDMPAILAAAAGKMVEQKESDIDNSRVQNSVEENAEAAVINDKQREQLALLEVGDLLQWGSVLLKQVGSPFEEFSEYTKERVASAQTYRQLKADPEQRERVDFVQPIVEEFFKTVGDGQQLVGTNYTLKREGDTRSVIANDGRSEVLRLVGRWVEKAALSDKDVALWQLAEEKRLEQKPQKKQLQSQQRSQNHKRGLEL